MSIPLSLNTASVNLNTNPNLIISVPPVGDKSSVASQQSTRQDTTQFGQDKPNANTAATPQDAVSLEWTDKDDVSKAIATAVQNSDPSATKKSPSNSTSNVADQTTTNVKQEEPEWTSLQHWTPSGINMGTNLRELTNRFTVLLNFIDQNFTGDARTQMLSMLESMLNEKLQLVYQNYTEALTEFFGNYGQQTASQSILDIIKEVVTSKTNLQQQSNPKEAAKLWDAANNPSDNRNAARLQSFAANASRLPSLSSKNETLPFTLMDIQKATKFIKEITPAIQSAETESLQQALSASPKQTASSSEATKQLLPSLSNHATTTATTAQSASSRPSMAGLDLGLLSMKTEAFIKNANISPAMANAVKSAVNQFFTNYSSGKNSSVSSIASRSHPEDSEVPDKRLILLVNDRMAEEYRKSGNVDKSIQAGIQMVKNVYDNHPEKQLELSKKQPKAFTFWEIIYLVKEKKDTSVPAEELLNRLRNNWNGFVRTMELNKGNDTDGLIWNYYRSGLAESMLPKGLHIRPSRPTHLSLSSMFAASWFIIALLLVFIRIAGFPIPSIAVVINLVLALVFGLGVSFRLAPGSKDSDNISH